MIFILFRIQDEETWRKGSKLCQAGLNGGSGNAVSEE